jgi:hypothetical protein
MGGWRPPWEGIHVDDSMRAAVLADVSAEVGRLYAAVVDTAALDLEAAEGMVRDGVLAIGARVLEAGLAARGTGKVGLRHPCPCGGVASGAGSRTKGVQTVVGWIIVRRAYYHCPACGHGHCPLDAVLGLARDSLSPGVRRVAGRLGARLPFAQAAAELAATARIQLSASTVRTVTEAVGAQREAEVTAQLAAAWGDGLPLVSGSPPDRLYVAMDGIRILGTDGAGREVKVGMVVPVRGTGAAVRRERASYVAGLEPAARFGQRLALAAHQHGVEHARLIAVLGDGAEWIWTLAAEHFPTAVHIVDWYHASERIYDQYRAAGWDIGSGMVESACKHLIAAREKGAGMRWSERGAHTVAAVRVLLANGTWDSYGLAA